MTPHWVVVAIAFMGPAPVDSKFIGPIENEEKCEEKRKEIVSNVQGMGFGVFAKCMFVTAEYPKEPEKPKGEPGTEQRS
jgi:hypothetical protein